MNEEPTARHCKYSYEYLIYMTYKRTIATKLVSIPISILYQN